VELGFETLALQEKLLENGAPISSTRSRGIIEAGQVELARAFLGRPYKMAGEVVTGDQLGRKIGIPTINLRPHPRKCVPKNGVYAIRATFEGETEARPSVLNIGVRPTVDGARKQIEFHVLDANIETAPRAVEVEFVARLRDERKFDGLEALVAQLKLDINAARGLLA
jgi:riboflavin kinase/FMN adenylyltransferase